MNPVCVEMDCCGNIELLGIGIDFGDFRVRVEGNCPSCGVEDPNGTIIHDSEEGEKNCVEFVI